MSMQFQSEKIKKKVLEMDGSDDWTTMWMYLMTLNCIFKNCLNSKFHIIYILPQLKKRINVISERFYYEL